MTIIDDKVVAMSFENKKFQHGVGQTLSSLDKLKAALHFPNAGKGLQDLDRTAKKVDLSHIGQGVEQIKTKLEALRLIAIGVFAQLTTQAIRAGGALVKAFTIQPLKAGFQEYTTNLNAVQTILANTQASGAGLKEVNAALDELNRYSDKTIYNFSQMARNIGTFTAAGVDLKTATASIKGIANLAALSGSNAEQASTAMYQLSQAIASGSVKLMDWNSVVNAGMGGTVFQRALAMTGEKMGTLKKGAVELVGPMQNVKIAGESFRNSLSAPGKDGWLTSKVLTETLQMLTSDLTDAELRAKGWNEEQIKAIQQQAKTAMLAATTVKTLTGVIDVARETAGSGWAKTWQIIFGDFEEAKTLFTRVSNAVNGVLIDSARARNNMLSDWKELGGRTALIDTIASAFKSLGQILQPIKDAFRQFFPAKTGSDLMYFTQQFEALVEKLKPSTKTIFQLRHTFAGLFAVLDIGWEIIKGVVGIFGDLIGASGAGSGSFLSFTNNIGNSLVAFHEWLIEGGRLAAFFDRLGAILAAPIDLLRAIATAVSDLFAGFSPGGFFGQVDQVGKKLSPLQNIMEGIATAWGWFLDVVSGSGKVMRPALDAIVELFSGIGPAISDATSGMNFDAILQVIQTGFIGGLVIMFKKFLGKGSIIQQLTGKGGMFGSLSGILDTLTGSMQAMQTNLKAKTLKEIAIAIALIAVSVVALSLVDPSKLKASLAAITVMFGQLLAGMAILTAITKTTGFIKLPFITASLILLAGAIDTLSLAVIALSFLSWNELLKGLAGVGALLVGLSAAVVPLAANSAGMIRAGAGLMGIAVALLVLASAVKIFSTMGWEDMGKGLVGIGIGLGLLIAATAVMPPTSVLSGISLIGIALALKVLAGAVEKFGGMDWKTIHKGLTSIGAALLIIAAAMNIFPPNMVLTAAGLVIVSFALGKIVAAVQSMSGMSMKEIAKGLIGLGGSLVILAAALYAMSGTLAGAAALAVAATGLALFIPPLIALGKQSWGQILKGMVALAGSLTILGVAAALLTPAIPALLGLGLAMALVGAGLALAGAGIFLIGAGLSALVVAAPTGVGILIAALVELQEGLIKNIKLFILGLLEIVRAFAATAPKFVDALVKILSSLIDGLIKIIPKLMQAAQVMLTALLTFLDNNQEKLIQAGLNLLLGLVQGIENNIGPLVTAVVNVVTKFLTALSNNMNRITTAGAKLLVSFLKGIANNLMYVVTSVRGIITKFITAIANNLTALPAAGLKLLTKFLTGIGNNLKNIITAAGNIVIKFIEGVGKKANDVVKAGTNTMIKFIQGLGENAVALANAAGQAIVDFLNGLTAAVNTYAPQIRTASLALGWAIIDGISLGLLSKAEGLYTKAKGIATKALNFMKGPFASKSPSKATWELGVNIIKGLTNGLEDTAPKAYSAAEDMSNTLIDKVKSTFQITSPSKVMYEIGKAIAQGFAQGIRGSADDVRNAFADLNVKLLEEMRNARLTIAAEEDRLAELLKEKAEKIKEINSETFKKEGDKTKALAKVQKQYAEAIAEAQQAIAQNQELLKKSTAAHIVLIKNLKDERKELIGLANQFDKVTEKLNEAEAKLADLTNARKSALEGFEEQYSDTPDISGPMTEEIADARAKIAEEKAKLAAVLAAQTVDPKALADANAAIVEAQTKFDELIAGKVLTDDGTEVDPVATYLLSLKNQALAVSTYAATLEQLRKLGLDEKTYKMLVEGGTANQDFATALLAGGQTAITGLNKLDTNLKTASTKLATQAASYLHDVGIAAQEGLIKGLKKDRGKLRKAMEEIAREMLRALRKELKAKSPSEEFAEIGTFAMQGLALGFSRSKKIVIKAIEGTAQDALEAMRNSMRYISDAVTDELNPNPIITPILDLTQVRSQSQELAAITAGASLGQAATISAAQIAAEAAEVALTPSGTSITYEQNNYSPKALSDIEIYRHTKNQLSQLKSVLAT